MNRLSFGGMNVHLILRLLLGHNYLTSSLLRIVVAPLALVLVFCKCDLTFCKLFSPLFVLLKSVISLEKPTGFLVILHPPLYHLLMCRVVVVLVLTL